LWRAAVQRSNVETLEKLFKKNTGKPGKIAMFVLKKEDSPSSQSSTKGTGGGNSCGGARGRNIQMVGKKTSSRGLPGLLDQKNRVEKGEGKGKRSIGEGTRTSL